MKVMYQKDIGLAISFNTSEYKYGLIILKALYKFCGAEFINDVIKDIEEEMKPKQLPFDMNYRICEVCITEVDIRSDNALHLTGLVDKWKHKTCKLLKADRPN